MANWTTATRRVQCYQLHSRPAGGPHVSLASRSRQAASCERDCPAIIPVEGDGTPRRATFVRLFPYAEEAIRAVICGDILDLARNRTRFLTLGIDLNVERHKEERIRPGHDCLPTCPRACTHAELVAVFDTASARVIRWTGKSYPTNAQQHTLVHEKDLGSHLLDVDSERILVLGCHDLHIFSNRGRPTVRGPTRKEILSRRMLELAQEFKPTMILHHPHSTYSPRVWSSAWGATRSSLPSACIWASGLAFCGNPKSKHEWQPWQTLEATRAATASEFAVFDVVTKGYE